MIVLDTNVWIWWVNRDEKKLSKKKLDLLDSFVSTGLGVSVISCLEVAQKASSGNLVLEPDFPTWIEQALRTDGVHLLDLTPEIAVASFQLPGFHDDPRDRMIVATARQRKLRLATTDREIIDWYDRTGNKNIINFRRK